MDRSFKTRLEFLLDIFTNPDPPEKVLRNSIEHRLGRSYEVYVEEVEKSLYILVNNSNPMSVIKKINKE